MANLPPDLPILRQRTNLDTFEWRLVSSETEPIQGEQKWQEVRIPHYTGPINKAEACYRKKLIITKTQLKSDQLFLHFNATDYRVEIYINNKKVGIHVGLFGAFEFNIKPWVHVGDNFFVGPDRKFGTKIAPCEAPGWDEPGLGKGWQMSAPGFGIWQQCYLETRQYAFIKSLFVRPLLDEKKGEVWIELPENISDEKVLSEGMDCNSG